MSDRVLVTGGAGCIGSDLAGALLSRRGCQVTVIDNLSSGKIEHLEELRAPEKFRFVEADLLDRAALDRAMEGVDMVWHLAAQSRRQVRRR